MLSRGGVFYDMKLKEHLWLPFCGFLAGAANGLLGAGGGMLLVPMLTKSDTLTDKEVFPSSVSIILPICIVSLLMSEKIGGVTIPQILPYLIGSTAGGLLCGLTGKKIPTLWLHRLLGVLILWGGMRYLW